MAEAAQHYHIPKGGTEILIFSFANRLAVVHEGTIASATSTTAVLAEGASASDDTYNSYRLLMTSGTGSGSGQSAIITDYTGSTRTATVASWQTQPDATTTVKIVDVFTSLTSIEETGTSDLALASKAITTEISYDSLDGSEVPPGQALEVKVTAPATVGDYTLTFTAVTVRGETEPWDAKLVVF